MASSVYQAGVVSRMCVLACACVSVSLSVSANVRAKRQVSSWNAWMDISPPQLLDLLSLSLILLVRITPPVPLATASAVARVAQFDSPGSHHSPCATCRAPLSVL